MQAGFQVSLYIFLLCTFQILLQCRAVVSFCEDFLLRAAAVPSSWRKY